MYNTKRRKNSCSSNERKHRKFSLEQWRNIRKYRLLAQIVEESDRGEFKRINKRYEDRDLGMNDLDFYLGVNKNPSNSTVSFRVAPKLKQIPFRIVKKNSRKQSYARTLCEKTGILKLFVNKRDSDSSSESYTECESCAEVSAEDAESQDNLVLDAIDRLNNLSMSDVYNMCQLMEGAQISEISEGTPCDNCPELCPGFTPHHWRSTCKACGCDRLKHAVFHEELCSVRNRLGLRDPGALPFSDSPPGLNASQAERYWEALSEKAPSSASGSTTQQTWRIWKTRALAYQLPKQDLALSHCRHVDEEHKKSYEDFVSARNEIALDIGVALEYSGRTPVHCNGCDKKIKRGDLAVLAPRLGEQALFHPGCFVCSYCSQLLVELAHCVMDDGRLYCIRHYDDKMKPRCYACDELFKSCPSVIPPHPPPRPLQTTKDLPFPSLLVNKCEPRDQCKMGLLLSVVISYAGVQEAIECIRHILSGMVPETEPDFQVLVDYYTQLLHKYDNPSSVTNWTTECGQGYLCLTEDEDGKLKSAALKYYDGQPSSTAILFSTKISSFGQEVEDSQPHANGNYRTERYTPTRTKTIISNTSDSFSVGIRKPSPTNCDNISDATSFSENSFAHDANNEEEIDEAKEKLTWHYRPRSPIPQTLPEIHFQSFEGEKNGDHVYSEEFLRSLDGIKYRPLQRSDPSGRRRSYKKRHSSSSTSSRDSRASREEELKMFTSLEEAEFERMNTETDAEYFGNAPNLSARSYSRSRSRENSKERRNESWSNDPSVDSLPEDDVGTDLKPRLKDMPKLGSFEEEQEEAKQTEVMEAESDADDFWGSSGD